MSNSMELASRMKDYEGRECGRKLIPLLPAMARIDGRCFSKFTKKMQRPYDKRLSDLMIATTNYLCEQSNATIGYTQSDEISLAWWASHYDSEIFFGGRIQKMASSLAALATGFFVHNYEKFFGTPLPLKIPTFDCRVWNVPTAGEGANVFLWRELDATKNSISMAARSMYSHKELVGKNSSEMQEMMWQKGTNWNDYPDFFKRGTFRQRRIISRKFSAEEIEKLPEKHAARSDPELVIQRSEYKTVTMPSFRTIANREAVVFAGADPIVAE